MKVIEYFYLKKSREHNYLLFSICKLCQRIETDELSKNTVTSKYEAENKRYNTQIKMIAEILLYS